MKGPFTDVDSLKEPFTDRSPSLALAPTANRR